MISKYYDQTDPELTTTAEQIASEHGVSLSDAWKDHVSRTSILRSDFPEINPKYVKELANAIFHLDLSQMWFSLMGEAGFVAAVSQSDTGTPPSAPVLAVSSLCGKAAADLLAIRVLSCEGLSEQTEQITRSMSEGLDVLSRVTVDDDFCRAYLSCANEDQQNQFWHSQVAKGKTRKFVYAQIEQVFGNGYGDLSYRLAEERILSTASHPSHYSGFSSLFTHQNAIEEGEQVGKVRAASNRTITYANYRCTEYAVFDRAISHATEHLCAASPAIVDSYDTAPLKNECRCLREITETLGRNILFRTHMDHQNQRVRE